MSLFAKSLTQAAANFRSKGTESRAWFIKRASYCIALVMLTSFILTGCQEPEDDFGNLNGTWLSYDSYIISASTNEIEHVGNYKADIVNFPDYKAKSGVLIIKFTWYFETIYDESWKVVSSGETTKYNEKYGAVYWNNLKSKSVKIANAYDTVTWAHAMFDNLTDAQTNFTIDKTDDYISMWGAYKK